MADFDWPLVLGKLARREDLSEGEAGGALAEIMEGAATPAQTAALLVALRLKGETVEEMTGLVRTMLAFATPLNVAAPLVDTCGTGGDRSGTLNVSTLAALVVAGAGGRVAKHGNRAASSRCGSADLLEGLGVKIDIGPEGVARCIEQAGIGFCFAQRFHPAMKHVSPVRRELGIPTVMNVLGPLSNPARVQAQVIGVYDGGMAERMTGVLRALGTTRAMIVHGHDGLDEISTATASAVVELRDDAVRTWEIDPRALGIPEPPAGALSGGDVERNVAIATEVLSGARGAARDIVTLNAAAALVVAALAGDLASGMERAAESIDSGRARGALEAMVEASRE